MHAVIPVMFRVGRNAHQLASHCAKTLTAIMGTSKLFSRLRLSGSLFVYCSICTLCISLPLDDTHRNGFWEDEHMHLESSVYTALSSSSTQPTIREAAHYLEINQNIKAPELTNPPRMPQCLSSRKVSTALTEAINVRYAAQLKMNASVDTTYIQDMRQCDYSSFITYAGPEEVRMELVDAANSNKLCDLLPKYCEALNLVPAPQPSTTTAEAKSTSSSSSPATTPSAGTTSSTSSGSSSAAGAASSSSPSNTASTAATTQAGSTKAGSTSPSSSSSSSSSRSSRSSSSQSDLGSMSQPIDSQHRRSIQRRSSVAAKDPYILQSSSGTANPELPPVLDFKCIKHNLTQVMDHFPDKQQGADAEDRYGRLQGGIVKQPWDNLESFLGYDPEEVLAKGKQKQKQERELDRKETFDQVYWVCDAAWPKDKAVQVDSGNVIVFLGNESPLGIPKQPIVFENARRLNALVVLVEHRYYGESLPYPEHDDERMATERYKWLTIEQVIEDTATVVQHVRKERGVPQSVPIIVIGGSYGGMIASYHRVVRPDVFDAAIAASAPIYYIVETKMWRQTSNRYHQFIEDSANTMSGSLHCSDTVREALEELLRLGETQEGREEVAKTMNLCGSGEKVLPDQQYVLGLQDDIIGQFQGLAQVNNQPPVLGEMAIGCAVINNATKAGQKPLAAVAALYSYFGSNGSSNWCYNFTYNPKLSLLPDSPSGFNSYTYQGTVFSSLLPAQPSDSTMNPVKIPVPVRKVEDNCRNIFGKQVPEIHGPGFARHIMPLLKEYGNVVFTNGDLDGWAGGSLGLLPLGRDSPQVISSEDAYSDEFGDFSAKYGGLTKRKSRVAFVVYRNASHCTDTHTNTWRTPGEPEKWKRQRAMAMNYAVEFARNSKRAASS